MQCGPGRRWLASGHVGAEESIDVSTPRAKRRRAPLNMTQLHGAPPTGAPDDASSPSHFARTSVTLHGESEGPIGVMGCLTIRVTMCGVPNLSLTTSKVWASINGQFANVRSS